MTKGRAILAAIILIAANANAQSQDADVVQLYGRFNLTIEGDRTVDATRAVPRERPTQVPASAYTGDNRPARSNLTSNGSALGFRGSERLAPDLYAWFQVESGVPIDSGDGVFASRNTAVGLRSKQWGTLLLGQWDTPYKAMLSRPLGPFWAVTNADYTDLIGNPGFGVPAGTTRFGPVGNSSDAAFDRRQGNSVQYWTPTFAGLRAQFAHSVNESKASEPVPISPTINSFAVVGSIGALQLGYAYEEHNDYFGLKSLGGAVASKSNTGSKDRGHRVIAQYKIGATTLSATAERLDYKSSDKTSGNVNRYKRDAYFVSILQAIGRGELFASYGKAGSGHCYRVDGISCITGGLGAEMWTLGAKYILSRRTFLYSFLTEVKNEESARYGVAYYAPPAPGGTTRIFAAGMNHDF